MKTVINKIYLHENGKQIMFQLVGGMGATHLAEISAIQRPMKANSLTEVTNFGFPVLFQDKMYILGKEAKIKNKDVFQ